MPATYFEYPYQGNIYVIDIDECELRNGKLVKLPNGNLINITVSEGYFPRIDENTTTQKKPITALVVIGADDTFTREFTGDWEPLIELINIAAAVNTLFAVILIKKEYRRLEAGGLAKMKKDFSERAFALLSLQEDYIRDGKPSLELFRTGRCP